MRLYINLIFEKQKQSKITKSPRPSRNTPNVSKITPDNKNNNKPEKSKRKTLNPYQKFVKHESVKDKYKDVPGKQRLAIIAQEWKKINKS